MYILEQHIVRFLKNTHIPSHQGILPRVLETFCFQTLAFVCLGFAASIAIWWQQQRGKNSENTRQIQIRWPRQQHRTVKMKKISTDSKCHFCAKKNSLFFFYVYIGSVNTLFSTDQKLLRLAQHKMNYITCVATRYIHMYYYIHILE